MVDNECPAVDPGSKTWEPVSVVIPTYNEEAEVAVQVQQVSSVLRPAGISHEIVVGNDDSTDRTVAEAGRLGTRVLRHIVSRGYGASTKTGILAAQHDALMLSI